MPSYGEQLAQLVKSLSPSPAVRTSPAAGGGAASGTWSLDYQGSPYGGGLPGGNWTFSVDEPPPKRDTRARHRPWWKKVLSHWNETVQHWAEDQMASAQKHAWQIKFWGGVTMGVGWAAAGVPGWFNLIALPLARGPAAFSAGFSTGQLGFETAQWSYQTYLQSRLRRALQTAYAAGRGTAAYVASGAGWRAGVRIGAKIAGATWREAWRAPASGPWWWWPLRVGLQVAVGYATYTAYAPEDVPPLEYFTRLPGDAGFFIREAERIGTGGR